MTNTATQVSTVAGLPRLLPSWRRHLRAANLSPRTIQSYLEAGDQFAAYVAATGMPDDPANLRREHVEAFIEDLLSQHSASTAANRYRSLQQLFRWLVDEGEIAASPMARTRPPKVPEQPVPIFSQAELRRLLDVCSSRKFDDLLNERERALKQALAPLTSEEHIDGPGWPHGSLYRSRTR